MIPSDSIQELWRFPVKSMQGERLAELAIGAAGAHADRAYGVFDLQTGQVASAKNVQLFPDLMRCRAAYLAPPGPEHELPPVRVDLPDGRSVRSDSDDMDPILSDFFGRTVTLVRAPADILTYRQYTAEHLQARSSGGRDRRLPAPLAIATGALRDAFPMSLVTTSTLDGLGRPGQPVDLRRFRMNVVVRTSRPGFVENDWLGRTVVLGSDCRLAVKLPDPRCVMATLAQGDLARDPEILKTIARRNRLPVEGLGQRPCVGVYAAVVRGGTVRVGDPVRLQ